MMTAPKSTFMKVKCQQCKNEQILFDKASTHVKCLVCGKDIARPVSGKAELQANVITSLE